MAHLNWQVERLEETASTNTLLKERARRGVPEGTVLLAERQSAGRGRLGRSFLSPHGGLYMSLLLRPNLPMEACTDCTAAAAVCTARALEQVCGIRTDIKWVNDLMMDGKKLCGILTEGIPDRQGNAAAVVVGIGLNLRPLQTDDKALAALVTSAEEICGLVVEREELAAAILAQMADWYASQPANRPQMVEEYRRRMFLTGRQVTLSIDPDKLPHTVLGVDDRFHLLVRTPEGEELVLQNGEVSVLPLEEGSAG